MRRKAILTFALIMVLSPGTAVARPVATRQAGHASPKTPQALSQPGRQAFRPTVLSRAAWGADESLGIVTNVETPYMASLPNMASPGKTARQSQTSQPRPLSEREQRCRETVQANPEDFRVRRTETHNQNGEEYVWERRYSPQVKLLVIHHTGETETPEREALSGIERVRAIYRGHTVNNGWGDIGYHYLIDREGIIYEGRAGGPNVVGGHVYCANVGTIGIALIGNFLRSYPSETQLKSLQWLLADLSETYRLRPNGRTTFQGNIMPTIVTHRDLGPSQDPGRKTYGLMPALRRLVARRDFTTPVVPALERPRFVSRDLGPQETESAQIRRPGRTTYAKKIPRRVQRRMVRLRSP